MSHAQNLARLFTNLRINLPGALDSAIRNEFFMAMKEFLQDSNVWRDTPTFDVFPDQTSLDYDIAVDAGEVVRVISVVDSGGVDQKVIMQTPKVITLNQAPSTADTWTATVSLTVADPVSRDGDPVFPDWIFEKYMNEIFSGVCARMMTQPVKPYTNVVLGAYHAKVFRRGISKAKVEANHGHVYRAQNWAFPQNFARPRIR